MEIKNLFKNLPHMCSIEIFDTIIENCSLRIERIISEGHATPAGQWYDQTWDEWVVLLQGSAGIQFEGDLNFFILKPVTTFTSLLTKNIALNGLIVMRRPFGWPYI